MTLAPRIIAWAPTTPSALISKPIRLSKKNSLPRKANVNSASAESDWKDFLSTENTTLLAVRMIESAIDSTNAYVPRRLKVASGQLSLRAGGEGGPVCGESGWLQLDRLMRESFLDCWDARLAKGVFVPGRMAYERVLRSGSTLSSGAGARTCWRKSPLLFDGFPHRFGQLRQVIGVGMG